MLLLGPSEKQGVSWHPQFLRPWNLMAYLCSHQPNLLSILTRSRNSEKMDVPLHPCSRLMHQKLTTLFWSLRRLVVAVKLHNKVAYTLSMVLKETRENTLYIFGNLNYCKFSSMYLSMYCLEND